MNEPKVGSSNLLDNITFSIDIDTISSEPIAGPSCVDLENTQKKKNIRIIHCGDGIVEECDEEEEEKLRLEKEEKEKQIELQKQMDIQAKSLSWIPWSFYMAKRTAVKSIEACDYAGEKLAWWLGITKPKFLYEIEEALRIKKEQEERNKEDEAEAVVVGVDGQIKIVDTEKSTYVNYEFRNDENNNNEMLNLYNNKKHSSNERLNFKEY